MARMMVVLGVLGLMGLVQVGVAQADFGRQLVGHHDKGKNAKVDWGKSHNDRVDWGKHDKQRVKHGQRKQIDWKRGQLQDCDGPADVPELDGKAAPLALALLFCAAALVTERRRNAV